MTGDSAATILSLLNLLKYQTQAIEHEISFIETKMKKEECLKKTKEDYDSELCFDKMDLEIFKLNCGRLDEILKKIHRFSKEELIQLAEDIKKSR